MTLEEADDRLAAGWHVDLPEAGSMCSAQQKRYLRLERERLLPSVVIPIDEPLVERPTCSTSDQASTSAFLSAVSLTSSVLASADLDLL